jgi:hypothetical protein
LHDDDLPPDGFLRMLRSRTTPCGERRLALAVLDDAVGCLNGNQELWKIPPRLFRWEAEQWFESRARGPLFSFERVCTILHLDAEGFRERIRRWRAIQDRDSRHEVRHRAEGGLIDTEG